MDFHRGPEQKEKHGEGVSERGTPPLRVGTHQGMHTNHLRSFSSEKKEQTLVPLYIYHTNDIGLPICPIL